MRHRYTFGILLALALGIRLTYVFLLPLGETVRYRLQGLNDEPSHFNYVHYLADNKRFPVQHHHVREKDAFIENGFEYFQPPVYYILGAFCEKIFGKPRSFTACRLLSFLFGLLSLLVIKKIFVRLGFCETLANGAVLFAAFYPPHAYFCSVASNDSLSWLVMLLLTYEIARLKNPDQDNFQKKVWHSSIWIGALLGVGMLIKSSVFIFFPVMAALFLYRAFFQKNLLWIGGMFVSFVLSALIAGPWYVHNLHQYGSLFAFSVGNGPPQFFLFSGRHFLDFIKWTLTYFWFPMQHVPASHAAGRVVWLETFMLLCNVLLLIFYIRKAKRFAFWKLLFCFLVLVNCAAYIQFNLHWSNAEGRYLLPSFVPILLFFCVPIHHYGHRFRVDRFVLPILCAEAIFPYVNLLLVR